MLDRWSRWLQSVFGFLLYISSGVDAEDDLYFEKGINAR
jgi:hypothetical protein